MTMKLMFLYTISGSERIPDSDWKINAIVADDRPETLIDWIKQNAEKDRRLEGNFFVSKDGFIQWDFLEDISVSRITEPAPVLMVPGWTNRYFLLGSEVSPTL